MPSTKMIQLGSVAWMTLITLQRGPVISHKSQVPAQKSQVRSKLQEEGLTRYSYTTVLIEYCAHTLLCLYSPHRPELCTFTQS